MKQNLFYFLLLVIVCIIRFTFLFDLLVLSILILLVISSIGFDLKGITATKITQPRDERNKQREGSYRDSVYIIR